jgi:hypothetical protein
VPAYHTAPYFAFSLSRISFLMLFSPSSLFTSYSSCHWSSLSLFLFPSPPTNGRGTAHSQVVPSFRRQQSLKGPPYILGTSKVHYRVQKSTSLRPVLFLSPTSTSPTRNLLLRILPISSSWANKISSRKNQQPIFFLYDTGPHRHRMSPGSSLGIATSYSKKVKVTCSYKNVIASCKKRRRHPERNGVTEYSTQS